MENVKKELKVLCISDTHGMAGHLDLFEEEGDIFIHAGDFTVYCPLEQVYEFCEFLDRLKFRHKIVICGNHEVHFDEKLEPESSKRKRQHPCEVIRSLTKKTSNELKEILKKHCTYLEHELVEIEGLKIFGSPYTALHGETAFSYERENGKAVWGNIMPVVILATHAPPYEIFDVGKVQDKHLGCKYLLEKVLEIKPRLHVFGHIH